MVLLVYFVHWESSMYSVVEDIKLDRIISFNADLMLFLVRKLR